MKVYINYTSVSGPYGGGNQFLKALAKAFQERGILALTLEDADAVLTNSFHNANFFIREWNHLAGKIIVHRLDGVARIYNDPHDRRDDIVMAIHRQFASATIFQSAWSRQAWLDAGIKTSRYETTIINAPDSDIFHAGPRPAFNRNRKVRIVASAWSPNLNKGFDVLAWLDQHLDFDRFEVFFVGNSPLAFQNIHERPPCSSSELAEFYHGCDIYLSTARREACSNALIEALHCGLPAVAFADGGNPEIVQGRGLLFSRVEELPAIFNAIVQKYETFQSQAPLPGIMETARRYEEFISSIAEDKKRGVLIPKKVNVTSGVWIWWVLKCVATFELLNSVRRRLRKNFH